MNEEKHYSMCQLKNWRDEGWVFRVKKTRKKRYIVRNKGQSEKSLGRFTDELWNKINEIQMVGAKIKLPEEELELLEQRSLENMVYFYRHELRQIMGGNGVHVLSDNVRKRMVEHGIITRVHQSAHSVTPLGKKMLEREEEK